MQPGRKRVSSRFAKRDGVSFVSTTDSKPDVEQWRHSIPLMTKAEKKHKRASKALLVIAKFGLWHAFLAAKASGLSSDVAAAKVVTEYRSGIP